MVMNAIQNRKSVRKYSAKVLDDDILRQILDAGRLAPSWINVQPWKFIVVKSQQMKDLLSASASFQPQVKNAQAVICCIADLEAWDKTNFGKILLQRGLDEDSTETFLSSTLFNPSMLGDYEVLLRSVEQISFAVSYMALQAQEFGVGACVVGAISNELTKKNDDYAEKVKAALGLTSRQVLVSYLTLGYEESPSVSPKIRKSFDEIVYFEKIGQKF